MKQCDLTKGLMVFLTIMITLFCGVMPGSWAKDSVVSKCDCCKKQKFKGCYGFSHDGMMMMMVNGQPSEPSIPMASAGVFFLKKGKLTGHEIVNFGGTSFYAEIRGKYTVDPDCTGTAWICSTPENGDPGIESEISFVITGCNFDEMQMVTTKMTSCDDNGDVVAIPLNIVGIAKKQGCDD